MFSIELTSYGLKLRSFDCVTGEEAKAWAAQYRERLNQAVARGTPFGQYVDLRGCSACPAETQNVIADAMKAFKQAGGARSAVVLDTPLAAMQITRLAKESGVYEWERYLDPETHLHVELVGLQWVIDGVDPDLRQNRSRRSV